MFCTQYNKEAKLWSGLNIPPLYNPKLSLAQAILKACEVHGSKIAQVMKTRKRIFKNVC